MPNEDFNDDAKDAGEIGAGHHVTALYELVPPARNPAGGRRGLPVRQAGRAVGNSPSRSSSGCGTRSPMAIRARRSSGASSTRASTTAGPPTTSSSPARSPASACSCGIHPRGAASAIPLVLELVTPTLANDPAGYRKEFVELVHKAKQLRTAVDPSPWVVNNHRAGAGSKPVRPTTTGRLIRATSRSSIRSASGRGRSR